MKHILLLFGLSLVVTAGFTQEADSEFERFGGFGGPFFQIGSVKGKTALIVGGGGGFLFNHKYFVGGCGESMAHSLVPDETGYTNHHFYLSHGGPWFGYIVQLNKKNDLFFSTKLGWGGATLIEDAAVSYSDEYFVINPSIEYERVFSPFFKLGVGATWPFYNGINNPAYNDKDVSKPSLTISVRLGFF